MFECEASALEGLHILFWRKLTDFGPNSNYYIDNTLRFTFKRRFITLWIKTYRLLRLRSFVWHLSSRFECDCAGDLYFMRRHINSKSRTNPIYNIPVYENYSFWFFNFFWRKAQLGPMCPLGPNTSIESCSRGTKMSTCLNAVGFHPLSALCIFIYLSSFSPLWNWKLTILSPVRGTVLDRKRIVSTRWYQRETKCFLKEHCVS